MAVSLKKPSKVDLTKPDLPRKLPECTPIHLIDEEETIKHRSTHVENEVQIRLHHSDEEDRKIWDLCFEFLRRNQIKRIIGIVILVVFVLAVLIALVVFLVNNVHVEQSPSSDASAEFKDFFSVVFEAFGYIFNSPVCLFFLGISFIGIFCRLVRSILKFH